MGKHTAPAPPAPVRKFAVPGLVLCRNCSLILEPDTHPWTHAGTGKVTCE